MLSYTKKASTSGPQTFYRGFAPGPHWETFVQTPYFTQSRPLTWNPEYAPDLGPMNYSYCIWAYFLYSAMHVIEVKN